MSWLTLGMVLMVSGVVEGRVLSDPDGLPIAGAVVTIEDAGLTATSQADGRFRLEGVGVGAWTLRVWAEGHQSVTLGVRISAEEAVRLDIALSPDPQPTADGLVLVAGRVFDEGRLRPVGTALVQASPLVSGDRREQATPAPGPVSTDADGWFSLRLTRGSWSIRTTAPGYRPDDSTIDLSDPRSREVEVFLELQPLPLPGLLVGGSGESRAPARGQLHSPSARVLDSAFVRLTPTTVERDVMRTVQSLPSVTPASDYSTALYVRGGTPDQTRIFLDGTPVYNPFHVGGFAAAFSPSYVDASVLSSGGLPASSPAALGGVLEVRTVDPTPDSLVAAGNVGLLSTSATVSGGLPGSRGAFLLSGRRTYLDVASRATDALGLINGVIPYSFDDGFAKLRLGRLPGGALTVSGYLNRERFVFEETSGPDEVKARWGSDMVALRGERILGDWGAVEGGVGTSGFGGRMFLVEDRLVSPGSLDQSPVLRPDSSNTSVSLRTFVADVTLRSDLGRHLVSGGMHVERTHLATDFAPRISREFNIPELRTDSRIGGISAYLEDQWAVSRRFRFDLGTRFQRPTGRSWHVLPRGRAAWESKGGFDVAVSGGMYLQDWWSLRNEESVAASLVAYDLLAPVAASDPLPTSWDAVVEASGRVRGWSVSVGVFNKALSTIPTAVPDVDPTGLDFLIHPDSVQLGQGTVRGAEFSISGRVGATTVAVGYRWQQESRSVGGVTFTPRTDRRHRATLAATRPFWGERELALSATWMSGIPLTPVRGTLPPFSGVQPDGRPFRPESGAGRLVYGDPNADRLDAYLRIDLETRGAWDVTLFGRRGLIEPYVSILNVLNLHNGLAVDYRVDHEGRVVRQIGPQLPIFPSLGLRWRF